MQILFLLMVDEFLNWALTFKLIFDSENFVWKRIVLNRVKQSFTGLIVKNSLHLLNVPKGFLANWLSFSLESQESSEFKWEASTWSFSKENEANWQKNILHTMFDLEKLRHHFSKNLISFQKIVSVEAIFVSYFTCPIVMPRGKQIIGFWTKKGARELMSDLHTKASAHYRLISIWLQKGSHFKILIFHIEEVIRENLQQFSNWNKMFFDWN
jgi:hypothetical protein